MPLQRVAVVSGNEEWVVYELADGNLLRIKSVLVSVERDEDKDGKPAYKVHSQLIVDTIVPVHKGKSN